MRHLVISVLIYLDQELSENVWFVWSKTSYSGDVTDARRTDGNDNEQGKIGLLSLWMLGGLVLQYFDVYQFFLKKNRQTAEKKCDCIFALKKQIDVLYCRIF